MSEEQKNHFFSVLKEVYDKGINSEKATAENLIKELEEKLLPLVKFENY
jgi:hypothetical protein